MHIFMLYPWFLKTISYFITQSAQASLTHYGHVVCQHLGEDLQSHNKLLNYIDRHKSIKIGPQLRQLRAIHGCVSEKLNDEKSIDTPFYHFFDNETMFQHGNNAQVFKQCLKLIQRHKKQHTVPQTKQIVLLLNLFGTDTLLFLVNHKKNNTFSYLASI